MLFVIAIVVIGVVTQSRASEIFIIFLNDINVIYVGDTHAIYIYLLKLRL